MVSLPAECCSMITLLALVATFLAVPIHQIVLFHGSSCSPSALFQIDAGSVIIMLPRIMIISIMVTALPEGKVVCPHIDYYLRDPASPSLVQSGMVEREKGIITLRSGRAV